MLGPNATSSGLQPRNAAARSTRVRDQRVGAPRRLVGSADVRVRLAEIAGDRVDDLVRALRAARPVEEGERPLQRAEPCADGGDVECGGQTHESLSATRAAEYPHIPWTPPPGGVDDEQR